MKKIISFFKKYLPKEFYDSLVVFYVEKRNVFNEKKLKNQIINFHKDSKDEEIIQIIDFLKNNKLEVFPYSFTKKYNKENIEVFENEENKLKYVLHLGKKLYFKRSMTVAHIKSLYQGLLFDQDENSPHLYLTPSFNLNENDVVADIGCAEGNFSLTNIENVKKIYLFESDVEWIEALEETFKPWKEKVEIINLFVTDYDSSSTISIKNFYEKHDKITFFKVDIEGEEQNFLNSCTPVFKTEKNIKMAICTYHKQNDENDFNQQLTNLGFEVEKSNGYMIFLHDQNLSAPYLRKGLLRAIKS